MITDENGVRHPECIADEVALREEREKKVTQTGMQRAFSSRNEGYKTSADRFFAHKAKKEGWAGNGKGK